MVAVKEVRAAAAAAKVSQNMVVGLSSYLDHPEGAIPATNPRTHALLS